MSDLLKEKTGTALFWSFLDRGGQQVIQMIFLFVLARLVNPSDFGLVAVLSIFTVIANLLQESGFSSALIRKKSPDETDFSSVFYFNIGISISIYLILFFSAPLIADFFDKPILKPLSRVIFLSFVFNAFGIIQNVHLIRKMDFRTNAVTTFIAGLISGGVAIIMAFKGYGVWSLVAQVLLQNFIRNLLLWIVVRWCPILNFSFPRIKEMFSYSAKLLVNGILNQFSTRIYSVAIGKYFSFSDVGYYDQATKLNMLPQDTIASSFQRVIFPVLSKLDSLERIKRAFRKAVRVVVFISFPVAAFTFVAAEPIVSILLSEKWLPIVPLLQILVIGGAFYPPYCLISSLMQALGKSGSLLKIETVRNILFLLGVFISVHFGLIPVVAVFSGINVLIFIYGFYAAGKNIGYSLKELFLDVAPYLGISLIVFLPLSWFGTLQLSTFLLFFMYLIIGFGVYLLIVKLMGSKVLEDCLSFFRKDKKASSKF